MSNNMAAELNSTFDYEFACSPCFEDDVNKEPIVYCENCTQYFCKSCLRIHNRVADAKQHQLLDKDEFQILSATTIKSVTPDLPTEKCHDHHGKIVDMYCEDHDEIGCNVCMTLEHRQCKHLHYIPDIASSYLSQQAIQAVSKNLSDRLDEFKTLKQGCLDTKTRITNEKDACLNSIKEKRKVIDEYLDEVETFLSDSVTDTHENISTKLDRDLTTCDNSISLLHTMKGKLQTSGSNFTPQTFIYLKRAEQTVNEIEIKLEEFMWSINDSLAIIYEEVEESPLSEILSPDTLFGNVKLGCMVPEGLNKVEDINVRSNSDKEVCDCNGLCQLPNSTIIITDWNNKNLKSLKYDNTFKQSDSLSMSNSPWGVCTINDNEVAVTVPDDQQVSIVSVSPKMAIRSCFNVNDECDGISYSDGYLYVGHVLDSKVTVYDLEGNYLKKCPRKSNGAALFGSPFHLCVKKQHIVVADGDKGIVIIDRLGYLVAKHTYPNQGYTHGVFIDDRGNVYIADYTSKLLLVLDMDGNVTTLQDNLSGNPQAVLFDKHRQRLLVAYEDKDDIQSFSLHYKSIII